MLRILENAGEHPAGFRAVLDSGLCGGSAAAVFLRRGQGVGKVGSGHKGPTSLESCP